MDIPISSIEFDESENNRIYEVEVMTNSEIYAKELSEDYILGLYYLVSWKNYPNMENI